jgi:hypothetical protein
MRSRRGIGRGQFDKADEGLRDMSSRKVILTAMLGGLLVGHAAKAGGADLSFTFQDLRPVTAQTGRVVVNVLPKTRHFVATTKMAGIVTIAHNREEHTAVALFTVFDCGKHQFQIQLVGRVGATGGTLMIAELAKPSETDAAMSPVGESPWGGAVEQVACKPD